ncbi:hypothetical protein RHS03_02106, partial [Rhizoctonia solani]
MSSPTNPYAPRVGCPMCSIVTATPNPTPLSSPHASTFPNGSSPTTSPAHQIIWKDENVTAYVEKNNPVSSKGHIIILLNFHVPSIYALSSTDLPLLVHIQRLATRLLTQLHPSSVASSFTPNENANPPPSPGPNAAPNLPLTPTSPFRVGFITPPFRDSKIPVTDHLHVHAYIGTTDLAGWWRAMAYSSVGWYSIEDLIAEIREQTSNNRVRSTNPERKNSRPIDRVPDAGARAGLPDGRELNDLPLAADGLGAAGDRGSRSPSRSSSMDNQPGPSRRDSHIPLMRVTTPDIVVENADEGPVRRRSEPKGSPTTSSIPLMRTPSSGSSPSPSPAAIALIYVISLNSNESLSLQYQYGVGSSLHWKRTMDATQIAARRAEILGAFEGFREEFDENNDRRERIIKTNRDITNHSKKLIFQLHRIAQDENSDEGRDKAIHKAKGKFDEVRALYAKIRPELEGEKNWRYTRSVSGGLQELIEALSLRHYLLHGQMISYDQVQQFLTSDEGEKYLYLAESDYLLGVSDLTGELMRLAISTITRKGGRDRALHTAAFVRACLADFESFAPHVRDLYKKQNETSASLRKIEDALYAIRVREFEHGSEGSFDDIISRFAYQFEKPQNVQDDEGNIGY